MSSCDEVRDGSLRVEKLVGGGMRHLAGAQCAFAGDEQGDTVTTQLAHVAGAGGVIALLAGGA